MNLFDILAGIDNGNGARPVSSTDDRFAAAAPPAAEAAPTTAQDAAMPAVPDFPGGVPQPRARPAAAPSVQPGSAPDAQLPAAGGSAGQGDDGLLAAVMGGSGGANRGRSALAALGAGMANLKNAPFKAQAFANPFGAALQGGNKDEERQYQLFTQRLAALDRALRARGIAVNPLRAALARRAAGAALPGQSTAMTSDSARGLPLFASATMPAAVAAGTSAGTDAAAVPEIDLAGQGTQDAPYLPQTLDDYAQIESGSHYLHPDGSVRVKP